jgi:hypothetical protein
MITIVDVIASRNTPAHNAFGVTLYKIGLRCALLASQTQILTLASNSGTATTVLIQQNKTSARKNQFVSLFRSVVKKSGAKRKKANSRRPLVGLHTHFFWGKRI